MQSDQHLCYLLCGMYYIWACYEQNFKFLISLCTWAGWFESHLLRRQVLLPRGPYIYVYNCEFIVYAGNMSCFCCLLLNFIKFSFFKNNFRQTLSECQMVWIQIIYRAWSWSKLFANVISRQQNLPLVKSSNLLLVVQVVWASAIVRLIVQILLF